MPGEDDITIEYEPESKSHYICWRPLLTIISSGFTKIEALHSLREAAHCLIDSFVKAEIENITEDN
ncbi:hypothetical protein ACFLUH_01350 [Chloroflexota bacterium]